MKKILMGLGLVALLAGCASHKNGMGGTSDESNQSMGTYSNQDSNVQFHNNADNGTGSSMATNSSSPNMP